MNWLQTAVALWADHGTKILGTLQTIVTGLVLIENLIPEAHEPYWQAAAVVLGAMTINRGFTNTRAQK
jgi:hypothetical protein